MVAEVGGWPLGLENMNIRLGIVDNLQEDGEPYSSQERSASFSSFTSSELNTEVIPRGHCFSTLNQSSRSFFQDRSFSLGRLIGMKPRQGGDFYLKDAIHLEECPRASKGNTQSNTIKRHEIAVSRGTCIPLLQDVLVKISPGRKCSRG